ncbi:MAG: ABC transporter permease [Alphaproteobacteria bacterium]|nr:ABC transporter permease [Alphaproteobacteria bacterium]
MSELIRTEAAAEIKISTATTIVPGRFRTRPWIVVWRISVLLVLLGIWETAARLAWIDVFFYSSPIKIAVRLWELVRFGTDEASLWYHLWMTIQEAVIGFVLGTVFGITAGIALGRNQFAAEVFSTYIKVLNAIPRVVLAPIFLLLFGFGLWSKVALSFVMVFFVVFANAFQGVREADRNLIANARILGASKWQITTKVILPSAMSWIFASLHISFGFAVVGAIVGEFIGSRYGIGFIIQTARGLHDTALMFSAIVVIVIVVLVSEYGMTLVENRLTRWRPKPLS